MCILIKNPVHPPLIPLFVAMYRQLHPDVSSSASPRIASCIATQFWGHRAHGYFLCGLAGG